MESGVEACTSSNERKGKVKCGRPSSTTSQKLKPAASSCSTGRVSSSNISRASFLNQSTSALSAAIGAFQNSGCFGGGQISATAVAQGFARQYRNQRRSAIPAEEEPGHAAHAQPTGEGQRQGPDDPQIEPLLRHPRRDRIHQLTIQKQHFEAGDHDLDDGHRNDG